MHVIVQGGYVLVATTPKRPKAKTVFCRVFMVRSVFQLSEGRVKPENEGGWATRIKYVDKFLEDY